MTEHDLQLDHDASLATAQRPLRETTREFPLWPPLTAGDPTAAQPRYPLEVDYAYSAVDRGLFDGPTDAGLERWAPLLPPLARGGGLGEGATPLVDCPDLADWCDLETAVYVKDESQNPTWSQKDHLNRCTTAAAVGTDATGIVASSSGNHGASAAAYAARHELPCLVLTAPETPAVTSRFLDAYDATVVAMDDWDQRMTAVDDLATNHGFHAVSSRTRYHTGHPFGPEGYKTIAYELFSQLGRAPGTVFVPTGFAEILFGVWKGFRELFELGVADDTPQMAACEPAARAPLANASEADDRFTEVEPAETAARSIQATRDSYRGHLALEESGGFAAPFSEADLSAASERLARAGFWQESAGAASVAGLRAVHDDADSTLEGPIVCLGTSSGFKDGERVELPIVSPSEVVATLRDEHGFDL